jgi:hypothetical protein
VRDLAALAAHRRDGKPVPERRTVPPVVQDFDDALALVLECRADLCHGGGSAARALQEPAVPAEYLRYGKSRDALEPLIGIDERTAGQPRVRDGDALRRDIERAVLQVELICQRLRLEAGDGGV